MFELNEACGRVEIVFRHSYGIKIIDVYQETEEARLDTELGYMGIHVNSLPIVNFKFHPTGKPPILNFHRCE